MNADVPIDPRELARFFTLCEDMFCIAGTDGFFKCVNPAWSRTLGWSIHELLARPYLELVHPDDREDTSREAGSLANGQTTTAFRNRYQCRDGSYRWLQWTAVLYADEHRLYAIARDVTALKETEDAVMAARVEAERATRAKNVFLSRMSHDLRTPLNAILGFAQLLEMDALSPLQMSHVRQVLTGGRHLLALITEVMDITRIESGRLSLSPEAVNVADIMTAALELMRPLALERNVTLSIVPSPADHLAVSADRQRLNQILLNLLSNAIKYNRQGGRVVVESETRAPSLVRINVRDTGAGIPVAKLDLLFQPFERLGAEQTAVEGTGLGLALSRGLAQAMGGSLGVESIVGQGSTFWVELAVAEGAARGTPRAHDSAGLAEIADRPGAVLYIEDNLSNVELMEGVLRLRPGLSLLHAADGHQGLAVAKERQPALIFLDLHLPEASGEEVLRWLQEDPVCRSIPVVVVTADASPGVSRRLEASGAKAFLTKPIDVRAVLNLLDRLLA